MTTKIILAYVLVLMCNSVTWAADESSLGSNDSSAKNARLEATVMNQNIPLEKRIKALKTLYSHLTKNGRITRHICIWDPLGKSGPIANTVEDQALRSLHYGMDLEVSIFNNERELVQNFKTETTCDAILIRGAVAMEFNKFSGTIEAVGALPERKHLQLLMQVFTSPKMNRFMSDGQYTVMGVATIGGNYAFMDDKSFKSLSSIKNKRVAVQTVEPGMRALTKKFGAVPVEGDMMANVQSYADNNVVSMLSPAIAYLVMGSGQISSDTGVLRNPISQSTMQFIGRSELFPDPLAQMLREDFLLKFDNYSALVDKEMALVPEDFWIETSDSETEKLSEATREVRIALRDEGYYDATMLRIARKIRCKFNPERSECINPTE
jgi:hypothetical protein